MKKTYALLLALIVAVTPMAQAKSCIWLACQYLSNTTFSTGGTGWTTGGSVSYPTTNACGASNKSAQLDNTETIAQSVYIDDSYNDYSVEFDLYLLNDTDNWYDQLKVTVKNDDTNVTETFYFHGSSFDNNCGSPRIVIPLSNDYDLSNITVKFENSYLATGSWQIDNVNFWGVV